MVGLPPNSMSFENLKSGLVSISFRKIAAFDVIEEVVKAGQEGVEWGGDIHVPHGDTRKAEQVARWTQEAGLETAAYGSYYRLAEPDSPEFEAVLDAAEALKAPMIRVWAGKKASADAEEPYRNTVKEDARRICKLAAKRKIQIAVEYHANTLTDSIESAAELFSDLQLDTLSSLWQPPNGQPEEICVQSLQSLLPRISNVHVFHWGKRGFNERFPLADGKERWTRYFELLQTEPKPRWALMEFVKDDSLSQYHSDALVLREMLKKG